MSTIVAILLGFALILVALAPLGLAFWKPAARLPVAALYAIMLSGLAVYHTGISFARVGTPPPSAAEDELLPAESSELTQRCAEALDVAEKGSIIRDRSNLAHVVVNRALWSQVPDFVKQGLVRCLEISRGPGQPGIKVEIVEQ